MTIARLTMSSMRRVIDDSLISGLLNKIQQDIRIYVFALVLGRQM